MTGTNIMGNKIDKQDLYNDDNKYFNQIILPTLLRGTAFLCAYSLPKLFEKM